MERLSTQWPTERIPPRFHQTVNTLIETLIKPDRLQRDLFFALLLILMKENDFDLLNENKDDRDVVNYIVELRNKKIETYEADLVLEKFRLTPVKVLVSNLSDVILVNIAIPRINYEIYSTCFFKRRYIPLTIFGLPDTFSCLEELCTLLKDRIITPVKGSILNFHNYCSANLTGIPSNILFYILITLPIKDILSMRQTSKKFYELLENELLWKNLVRRDFNLLHTTNDSCWQDFYINTYLMEKTRARSKVNTDFNPLPKIRVTDYDSRWEEIL